MKAKGLTLIELIIVITIIGALTLGFSWYFIKTIDLWNFLSFRNEIVNQIRIGLIRMGRDIRQIKRRTPTQETIEEATESSFQFIREIDTGDVRIRYRYLTNDTEVVYEVDQDLDGVFDYSHTLLSGASSFRFTYFDSQDNVTTVPSDIYRVKITLTVTEGGEALHCLLYTSPSPRD